MNTQKERQRAEQVRNQRGDEITKAHARVTELEAELSTANARAQEFYEQRNKMMAAHEAVSDKLAAAKVRISELETQRDHATDKAIEWNEYANELLIRAESALSASIEQGKISGNEVQVLREALEGLLRSIKPFASAVYNDNGDCTVTPHHDYDSYISAYSSERKARAALAQVSADIPR